MTQDVAMDKTVDLRSYADMTDLAREQQDRVFDRAAKVRERRIRFYMERATLGLPLFGDGREY